MLRGAILSKIIYVKELPVGVFIKVKKGLLVGTNQKGVDGHERLCSQER